MGLKPRSLPVMACYLVILVSPLRAAVEEEKIPLAEQLSGLKPAPRIAYLRHLMSRGEVSADLYFQLGVAFHESSQSDSAIHYYQLALEQDPRSFKALVNAGVLYDEGGDYYSAVESFSRAIKIKPDDVLARSHLAFLLFEREAYSQAWENLEIALRNGPEHPQPHFYLAIFFWESRMFREALGEWEKVTVLDPGSHLAAKALENVVMLQKALNAPSPSANWKPKR
ncbi:MAG: tetratricopeptide repeat protein [Candidatus Krumholzibacteriota bacterium]|nr:tetratricopeptide repeat protein [Candidatus Krumholzibacteriota bacterium]